MAKRMFCHLFLCNICLKMKIIWIFYSLLIDYLSLIVILEKNIMVVWCVYKGNVCTYMLIHVTIACVTYRFCIREVFYETSIGCCVGSNGCVRCNDCIRSESIFRCNARFLGVSIRVSIGACGHYQWLSRWDFQRLKGHYPFWNGSNDC